MGIRMLHRRAAQARTTPQADAAAPTPMPSSRIPALAADASTARIPADRTAAVRKRATRLRHRFAGRQWADLCRGYLALLLALLPKPRPPRRMTVFVAPLTERPNAAAPRAPEPDATP
ncbi:hypothetical protein [Streptomyces sp. NPDC086787]|uniref:hypothetical protein n=1 Tax=Streptomyces sp. NPDC086787 TaxID=3365759 RepID=UPI003819971B